MSRTAAWILSLAAYALAGCGGSPSTQPDAPSATPSTVREPANVPGPFLYVVGPTYGADSGGIVRHRLDAGGRILERVPGSGAAAGPYPLGMLIHPSGRFAYVVDSGPRKIWGYSINPNNGGLVPLPWSPLGGSDRSEGMAMDPAGHDLYLTNYNLASVSAYRIDTATGRLTPAPGSPFSTGGRPMGVSVHPSGAFVYVANQDENASRRDGNGLSAFARDADTGRLTPLPRSPFPAALVGNAPQSFTIAPSGDHGYLINNSEYIYLHEIDQRRGTPVLLGGGAFFYPSYPSRLAFQPGEEYAYAVVQSRAGYELWALRRQSARVPTLSRISGPHFVGVEDAALLVHPLGATLYVADRYHAQISTYAIDPGSGTLEVVPGSPTAAGTWPNAFAVSATTPVQ